MIGVSHCRTSRRASGVWLGELPHFGDWEPFLVGKYVRLRRGTLDQQDPGEGSMEANG
jgi:hypothetical protein